MSFEALRLLRDSIAAFETGPRFMGIPERWYEPPGLKFRCAEGHVSRTLLKSEERGSICMACFGPVLMTFPEDFDDPGVPAAGKIRT